MKKYIAMFLVLFSSNLYAQQSWQLGVKGAFEMRGMPESIGYGRDIHSKRALPSYGIGLFVKRHIWRRFSIMAEPAFHEVGSGRYKETNFQSQVVSSNNTHIRYSAILIPVGLNYKVGLKTAIEVGVAPTFLIAGKQTQTIYNSLSKIAPNVVKVDVLEKFYQERFDFPIFLGMNYELTKKIEFGLRIYAGNDYTYEIIQNGGNAPSDYVVSKHNTGLAFGIRYNFLNIPEDKKKDAHYKIVDDRF